MCAAGSSLGGIIFPIMIRRLLDTVGFPWTMRIVGFMVLALLALATICTSSFYKPQPYAELKNKRFFDNSAITTKEFGLLILSYFLFMFGMYSSITYLPSFSLASGMNPNLSFYIASIQNASSVFGRTIPPAMSDRLGRLNVQGSFMIISGLSVLCIWVTGTSHAQTIIFAIIYGFCTGSFVSLMVVCLTVITKDMTVIGLRAGTMRFMIGFAIVAGVPAAGALIKPGEVSNYGYMHMQIFTGIFLLAGGIVFLLFRQIVTKNKWLVKI